MTDSCLRVKVGMKVFAVSLDSSETFAQGKLRLQENIGIGVKTQIWYIFDSPSSMIILEDEKTQSAIILQLALIGEVSKKISSETKAKIDLPWKEIADRIIRLAAGDKRCFQLHWQYNELPLELRELGFSS